jgi:Uma2 family endonuclease
LIDGQVTMMASPTGNHQRICGYIARKIGNFLEGKKCEVLQDLNVHLRNKKDICRNVFRPDILVGCDSAKITDKGYEGTPEWVIEVVSPSTRSVDYLTKYHYYTEYGVQEYWIVDAYDQRVTVFSRVQDVSVKQYTFDEVVPVTIFAGLEIDFKEILNVIKG